MPRGRPRKSDASKKLTGNPGKRPLADVKPAEVFVPECPDWLPEGAQKQWEPTLAELRRNGRLGAAIVGPLVRYCLAYHEMIQATALIEKHGRILWKGDYVFPNPAVAQQRSAWAALDRLSAMLGLDPSSGMRIPSQTEEDDELDKFLASRGRK